MTVPLLVKRAFAKECFAQADGAIYRYGRRGRYRGTPTPGDANGARSTSCSPSRHLVAQGLNLPESVSGNAMSQPAVLRCRLSPVRGAPTIHGGAVPSLSEDLLGIISYINN